MKRTIFTGMFLLTAFLSGCAEEGDRDLDDGGEMLIPREVLFGNPDKASVRLSPDGSKIGYLAPFNGVLNVWVGPAKTPEEATPVTNDTGRGIQAYSWTYTSQHIIYIQDKEGDENWRIYSVNLTSGQVKDMTPEEGVQAQILVVSQKFPEEIIIGLNDRDPRFHDIYRLNVETGNMTLLLKNQEFAGFSIDDDYNVRFATKMTPDGGAEIFAPTERGTWETFMKVPMEDVITTGVLGFNNTGETLYISDSRDRNTAALFSLDMKTSEMKLLAEDKRSDFSDVMIHPTEKNVQAVAFNYERKSWQILDDEIKEDLERLSVVAGGDVEVLSRTLEDDYWIVAYLLDNGPVRYYLYDRKEKSAQFLFTNQEDLEGLNLAKMTPVIIRSRDGLDLVGYYTLPLGGDQDGDGKPDKPLPMVLYVHGGPWSRDAWGYNALHQWLANRGYAVLSVNFRGSTGFGKDLINAANLEWGAKMHDDLIDAVNWATQEGIADPDLIGIMGGSYGGYATLAGLTFTPEVFACGVDIVGPSKLTTLIESIPPYWEPQIEIFATRMGDHRTEEGRALLNSRSPLNYADRIKRPLLIGQGANDPRVKQNESDQIVQAMQEKGIPVTYVLYPDEGHGFAKPENRISFYAVAEPFLSKCLGGKYEPIGDDFEGSAITVPAGVEEVPGLKDAISAHQLTEEPIG